MADYSMRINVISLGMLIILAAIAVRPEPLTTNACPIHAYKCPRRSHKAATAHFDTFLASYYGWEFAGRYTANGEPFDPMAMTAASPTLPFGTRLRLCWRQTCETVRVNDRGPYSGNRNLDLSLAAATALGYVGYGVARLTGKVVKYEETAQKLQ